MIFNNVRNQHLKGSYTTFAKKREYSITPQKLKIKIKSTSNAILYIQ